MHKKSNIRIERVTENLKRELARVIHSNHDSNFSLVTVTNVIISRDLSYAKIFVTALPVIKLTETIKLLNTAAGFYRHNLAKTLYMQRVPKLNFIEDTVYASGIRIGNLLSGG